MVLTIILTLLFFIALLMWAEQIQMKKELAEIKKVLEVIAAQGKDKRL